MSFSSNKFSNLATSDDEECLTEVKNKKKNKRKKQEKKDEVTNKEEEKIIQPKEGEMKHVDKKKFTNPNHHYSETFCDKIKTQGTVFNSLEIDRFREGNDSFTYFKINVNFHILEGDLRQLLVDLVRVKITSVDKKNNRYHGEVGVTKFPWIDVLQNYSAYYIGIAI